MGVYGCSQVRPLGLFAVLTRNRQSALGLSGRTLCTPVIQPNPLCAIPPRQQLSITRRLIVRRWTAARSIVIIISIIIIIIIIIISCTNRKKQNSLLRDRLSATYVRAYLRENLPSFVHSMIDTHKNSHQFSHREF